MHPLPPPAVTYFSCNGCCECSWELLARRHPKKKRLKKKQICSLRFFCPFFVFYFLIQKKDKKRSKYIALDFSKKTNPKEKR
jgi:hypothetical protein